MTKVGVAVVAALAVVGIGVAGGAPGYLGPPHLHDDTVEVVALKNGAPRHAEAVEHDAPAVGAADAAPAPALVQMDEAAARPPEDQAGAVVPPLYDPALLPPVTEGVRVLRTLPTRRPVVTLTFDVEQQPGPAAAILDALRGAGVRASFGLTGLFAKANPDIVRRIVDDGHDIFNHTYSHPALPTISSPARRAQLRDMENVILSVLDHKPLPVFRPPYGAQNAAALRDVAAAGYPLVLLWDVDPQGFRGYSPARIAATALQQTKPGSIILLHGIPQDAAALPIIIRGLKQRGLGFVTVGEALGLG